MNVSVTKAAAVVLLTVGTCACSQTPRSPDRTPSWQRYEVVGSRITRRVNSSGQPNSAHTTVTASGADWEDMPQVSVNRRSRRPR